MVLAPQACPLPAPPTTGWRNHQLMRELMTHTSKAHKGKRFSVKGMSKILFAAQSPEQKLGERMSIN